MDMTLDVSTITSSEEIGVWERNRALILNSVIEVVKIDNSLATIARGDFYMILSRNNVPTHLWYPHLMVNGMRSSSDYDGIETEFKLLDTSVLEKLLIILNKK